MRHDISAKPLNHTDRNLISILCCFLIIVVMWLGVCLNNSSTILVGSVEKRITETFDGAIAGQPVVMNDLKSRVEDDLNEGSNSPIDHPGLANSVREKVRFIRGKAEHSFDSSAKRVESASNAVDERTEENVAKIQGKAVISGRRVGNAIEDVMGNVRNRVN